RSGIALDLHFVDVFGADAVEFLGDDAREEEDLGALGVEGQLPSPGGGAVRRRVAADELAAQLQRFALRLPRLGVAYRRADAGEDLLEVERAQGGEQDQQADDEACVAVAVGDERLVGGGGGGLSFEVERDQQVRAW